MIDSAVYLRKSKLEEGMETADILALHQKALLDHAARKGLHIIETLLRGSRQR